LILRTKDHKVAGITKYHRILQQLESMIQSGLFAEGKLPSEPELAKRLGVTRSVIRQAYGELEKQGAIERRAGSGTTLSRQFLKKDRIVSLTKQIRDAGMEPSTVVLAAKRLWANDVEVAEWVREAFQLAPEVTAKTPLYCIDRLRCGDGQPVARQTLYLLAEQFRADLLETTDFTKSIFTVYADHNRFVARADETIEARPATPEEIEALKMARLPAPRQWVYVRDRVTYDWQEQERVLECMHSIDRWDFFRSYRYSIQGAERVNLKDQQV
jgi:DNA-binding GntR family transcriptional regulator